MAKSVFAVSCHKADDKELADGIEGLCHQPLLCRQPQTAKGRTADGKAVGGAHLTAGMVGQTGVPSLPSASGRQRGQRQTARSLDSLPSASTRQSPNVY